MIAAAVMSAAAQPIEHAPVTQIRACSSVVIVRCPSESDARAPVRSNAPLNPSPDERFAGERARIAGGTQELDTVIIEGKRAPPKLEPLRNALGGAEPAGPKSLRTIRNPDGTLCTCVSPCSVNCCVCSSTGLSPHASRPFQ